MSLVPAFQVGLWNAWMLCVGLYAAAFVPSAMNSEGVEKRMEGEPVGSDQKRSARNVYTITHLIIMPFVLIYGIFVPLELGTWWFYAGLFIYLVGLIFVLLYSIAFSTAPLNGPLSEGIYTISRHPGYLGFFLAYLGIGIASASWLIMLCAVVWIVAWLIGIDEEERILLEKYGDAYREYMNQTPRWIGLPKNR